MISSTIKRWLLVFSRGEFETVVSDQANVIQGVSDQCDDQRSREENITKRREYLDIGYESSN